jgi:Tfp pilus assembly protein PilX
MRSRLGDERGVALVMALGVLIVLTIATLAMLTYTTDNSRNARYQEGRVSAASLAEAGVAEAMAVLSNPSNNALSPTLLPSRTSNYNGGTVTWSGVLDQQNSRWTITSTGQVANPSGAPNIRKTLHVTVGVTPTLSQTLNNQAWNYIYAFKPNDGDASTCEMTINNSVSVRTPLYVDGDLCVEQTAGLAQGEHGTTLVVGGRLTLSNKNQNSIGTSAAPITAVYVGNGCLLGNQAVHTPCSSTDNVFASTIGTSPPSPISPPTADWDGWYAAASPGPNFPCVAGSSSGTTPTFESAGSTTRNNSVTPAWNLTPDASYTCWTSGGQIAWNATTKVLTVNGTVFIDGSAYIQNGAVNQYDGQGTLYLSGTWLLKNSKLCAILTSAGTACDTTNWNPNTKALIIVANGNADNGLPTGDSVQLVSAYFQGGVYGTNTIELDTTSQVDGPMVGNVVILGQSVNTSFPFISFVPTGTPGNPIVYAQPMAPTGYDG